MRTKRFLVQTLAVYFGLAFCMVSTVSGAYLDNGDGTVTDTNTGLTWQKGDIGSSPTWQNAISYCEALELAGHTDWRLPNIRELQSIVDYSRYDGGATVAPTIDPVFVCRHDYYWSSTTRADDTARAWILDFSNGSTLTYRKTLSDYVRCVRGGVEGLVGVLNLMHPNGGEVVVTGKSYYITWGSQNVSGTIQIDLYKGGSAQQNFLRQIAAFAPNNGSYLFTPPDDIPEGDDYLIRISAQGDTLSDFSNAFFRISGKSLNKSMPLLPLLLLDN